MNKKIICILFLTILLFAPLINGVSATSVFLTSDNIFGQKGEEVKMLNEIKKYIEEESNEQITVTVDPNAPGPSEGTRAMESSEDVKVNLAYACAGNLYELTKYSSKVENKVIFVNVGSLNVNETDLLRRAWDDNWSYEQFASISNLSQFLSDGGVSVIQPAIDNKDKTDSNGDLYQSDSTVNKYIANQIISSIESSSDSKTLNTALVNEHELNVSVVGSISKTVLNNPQRDVNETIGDYSSSQTLYLLSTYLYGTPLKDPKEFKLPDNPLNESYNTDSNYKLSDYEKMAKIVVNYMDEHGQAPNYIEYEGAKISYNDLLYNFALLSQNTTDQSHMNLPTSQDFAKSNDSIINQLIPLIVALIVIVPLTFVIIKRRQKR